MDVKEEQFRVLKSKLLFFSDRQKCSDQKIEIYKIYSGKPNSITEGRDRILEDFLPLGISFGKTSDVFGSFSRGTLSNEKTLAFAYWFLLRGERFVGEVLSIFQPSCDITKDELESILGCNLSSGNITPLEGVNDADWKDKSPMEPLIDRNSLINVRLIPNKREAIEEIRARSAHVVLIKNTHIDIDSHTEFDNAKETKVFEEIFKNVIKRGEIYDLFGGNFDSPAIKEHLKLHDAVVEKDTDSAYHPVRIFTDHPFLNFMIIHLGLSAGVANRKIVYFGWGGLNVPVENPVFCTDNAELVQYFDTVFRALQTKYRDSPVEVSGKNS